MRTLIVLTGPEIPKGECGSGCLKKETFSYLGVGNTMTTFTSAKTKIYRRSSFFLICLFLISLQFKLDLYCLFPLTRWTEVFLIKTGVESGPRGREADPTRVAEGVARAVGVALLPALPKLREEGLSPLAVRVSLDQDNVRCAIFILIN